MGPNNFAASGSMDDCLVSMGPNSFAASVSIIDGSDSMGLNSFGDSDFIDVLLDEEDGIPFFANRCTHEGKGHWFARGQQVFGDGNRVAGVDFFRIQFGICFGNGFPIFHGAGVPFCDVRECFFRPAHLVYIETGVRFPWCRYL